MAEHAQPPGESPGPLAAAEPDPRFLLASERTFLAWNRTALALIAGGIAVARFMTVGSEAAQLTVGLLLIASARSWPCAAIACGAASTTRRAGQALPPSELPQILTGGVPLFAVAAVALAILVFALR